VGVFREPRLDINCSARPLEDPTLAAISETAESIGDVFEELAF
jgi:hypothetical protein